LLSTNSTPTVKVQVKTEVVEANLSKAQRDVLLALDAIDFARAGRPRTLVVHWDGCRIVVFDTSQITL
jgi:hypothetical protein